MSESRLVLHCGAREGSREALEAVHHQFEAALPCMRDTLRYDFRKWPSRHRADAIADAIAACWHCWHGLVRRGKDPLAIGPRGIAHNAARYVRNGRRLGTGTCGRGVMDIYNPKAQKKLGLTLFSLDRHTSAELGRESETWHDWIALDNRVSPADEACFRLDFATWLASLSPRKREMAELLAQGHETGATAALLGVTPAAVSIARSSLKASWRTFQGEAASASDPSRGRRVRS